MLIPAVGFRPAHLLVANTDHVLVPHVTGLESVRQKQIARRTSLRNREPMIRIAVNGERFRAIRRASSHLRRNPLDRRNPNFRTVAVLLKRRPEPFLA